MRKTSLRYFFTAMLLSLAGMTLTANVYLLKAGAGAELWFLLISLVLSSVLGLFYYLRIIVALLLAPADDTDHQIVSRRISIFSKTAMVALLLGLLFLGLFPNGLLLIIGNMVN